MFGKYEFALDGNKSIPNINVIRDKLVTENDRTKYSKIQSDFTFETVVSHVMSLAIILNIGGGPSMQ